MIHKMIYGRMKIFGRILLVQGFLLLHVSLQAKHVDSVKTILVTRDYNRLVDYFSYCDTTGFYYSFFDDFGTHTDNTFQRWEIRFDEKSRATNSMERYKLRLIVHDKSKISYGCLLNETDSVLLEIQVDSLATKFIAELSFAKGQPVVIKDVFEPVVVYGNGCGWAGSGPSYRYVMEYLVATNNTKQLEDGLYSSNPGIRAYSVEGFYTLHKKMKYKLSPRQTSLIKNIKIIAYPDNYL